MASPYRFLNDVEALLVDFKGGHFLHDLLEQDVLLVVVALHRELGDTTGRNRGERQVTLVYKGRVYGCVCVYVCET